MQNLDFANDEHDTSDIGLQNTSDIEVEFDWDEALQNLESDSLEEIKIEDIIKPIKSPPICINQRLKDLYRNEKRKPRVLPNQHSTAHLLDKLVQKESFNMVILTLYPCNKGYSVGLCTTDGLILQESQYPYTQDSLLDYIDNQELPPPFLDYWRRTFPQVFYSGNVIVKVKDLRYTQEPNVRHVLLKPHTQTIINDVNLIVMGQNKVLSMEERSSVECAVVNTVQNPLCLDPSIQTGIRRFHSHYVKNLLNTPPIKNAVHRNSQLNLGRKRRAEDLSIKPIREQHKNLNNFIAKKRRLMESNRYETVTPSYKDIEEFISCKNLDSEFKDVTELALMRNQDCDTDCTPKLIEKYILEPDQSFKQPDQRARGSASNYQIKLEISERPANSEYVGTLYIGKDLEADNSGSKCSFTLGSKATASRYIEHFTEIFRKEKDGKPIRITHIVPGQPTHETCTAAAHDPSPKNQTNIRIQNNGKTFMQIGSNSTIGNIQQCSFKTSTKISVQQFQSQNVSGKTISADCTSEGTQFSSSNNAFLSRIAKSAIVNNLSATINRTLIPKQKILPRKMTISNSKIRPGLSNTTNASLKIPISSPSVNQRGQDQVLARTDVGIHSTINVSAISQNIQSVNTTSLKGFKSGVLRNVANVHTVTGTLESATSLQTVHLIASPKEKSVTSNGQTTTSSLSLSLPGLSALLADSPITNSQHLKKTSNSIEPSP